MKEVSIKIINQNEVAAIFKNRTDYVLKIVEDAFIKWANNEVLLPDKISQIFDQQTQNRINCMPATLLKDKVSGMKWVSVFPANALKSVPNVSGVMLLSEIKTGFPQAVIDGTLCTRMRTAAVGAVAAKYLGAEKSSNHWISRRRRRSTNAFYFAKASISNYKDLPRSFSQNNF